MANGDPAGCCVRKGNRTAVGIHFAEDGLQLHGLLGHLRLLAMRTVLRLSDYAIGWSEESSDLARQLAPRIAVYTMPGTGVDSCHLDALIPGLDEHARWFGEGASSLPRVAFVGRLGP